MYTDQQTDMTVDVRRFWASAPPVISQHDCKCGGGRFLGTIHSIAMYENHVSMFCELYSEEEGSLPFLNKDYFKILQAFEVATNGTLHVNYGISVNNLFHAWEECKKVLSSDSCPKPSEICVLLYYAASDSASLILHPAWKTVDADVKNEFNSVLNYIINLLKHTKYKNSIKICYFLISLIENPWNHHNFRKLLTGYASYNDVAKFLEFESSNMYALRLRILCQLECETEIFRLSSLAVNMYNFDSKNRQYFEEQDFEFIRDIYYACLIWHGKNSELIYHLKQYCPQNDGLILLKSYSYKIKGLSELPNEIRPRIHKCLVMVTEMASCTLMAASIVKPKCFDNYSKLLTIWSMIINTLMKSDLDFSMHGLRLKDMIYKFVNMAPTSIYIYKMCDILNDEFGSNIPRTMLIDMYTKALCSNINEKELYKQSYNYNESLESLGTLVKGYLKLANLVEDILSVCRECVLTAYSLMPSNDLLITIEKLAVKSGKLLSTVVPENSTGSNDVVPMNTKIEKRGRKPKLKACKSYQKPNDCNYTKIQNDLSNLPDPLSRIAIDNLISVIKSPRFGSFNWNLDWLKMKVMCQQYLDSLVTVINRNMLQPSDLRYLNMDIEEYNNWREAEIERIASLIKQNCSDDDSIVSATSSGEVLCYSEKNSKIISRKRKRTGKRKVDSQKRKKVGNVQKPAKEKKISPVKISKSERGKFECRTKLTDCPTESNKLPATMKVLPERRSLRSRNNVTENDNDKSSKPVSDKKNIKLKIKINEKLKSQIDKRQKRTVSRNQHNDYEDSCGKKRIFKENKNLTIKEEFNSDTNNILSKGKQSNSEYSCRKKRKLDESNNSIIKEKCNGDTNNILSKGKQSSSKSNNSNIELPSTVGKNQRNDYEDSCRKKRIFKGNKNLKIKEEFNIDTYNILSEGKQSNSEYACRKKDELDESKNSAIKEKCNSDSNNILSKDKQSSSKSNNSNIELPSTVGKNQLNDYEDSCRDKRIFKRIKNLKIKEEFNIDTYNILSEGKQSNSEYACRKKGELDESKNSTIKEKCNSDTNNILCKDKQSNSKSNNSNIELPSTVNKNQHNDYEDEDSCGKKEKFNESENSKIKEEFNSDTNNILSEGKQSNSVNNNSHIELSPSSKEYSNTFCERISEFKSLQCIRSVNTNYNDIQSNSTSNNSLVELPPSSKEHDRLSEEIPQLNSLQNMRPVNTNNIVNVMQIQTTSNTLTNVTQTKKTSSNSSHFEPSSSSKEHHLMMLSARIPLLNSLEFIKPVNTNHIVNVVQIQTTSNTLTNVTQTQTEHVSNDGIEKKPNDKQTHSLDNFVSVYQSNSLNNCVSSIQNSGNHQGECSFTGSVSLSNQRITTDSITNVHNINQQEISKPIETHDQNTNLDHQRWNDIHLQNSSERLQSTIENAVHLSSNVIVRTSDIINPSHVTQTSGQITNTMKKQSTYSVKARDRFIDLSLPASISSISTNTNRSTNIQQIINSNKSHFDSKVQQNSPVQTSVGSQVNFNNEQSEDIQNMISQSNQSSQKCTNITENSTSNITLLNDQINSTNSKINTAPIKKITSLTKENNLFDNSKPSVSNINPISSIQTQTCIGLRPSNEISNPNTSVLSLMITSAQSQVIKPNIHNSLYTSSQNQRVQHTDSQTKRSDEQKKIDNLKLISQTFTATSEAIKFVTSSTESQRLIQSTEKNNTSNIAIFQNAADLSNISQENDASSKSLIKGRGNMRTYESKTRALKQANMSDMFVFEKGTLYAVQDDVNQMESKSVNSPRSNTTTNIRLQSTQANESLEKSKPSPTASPNITITGSMLPRFQHVFGKTKFPSSTVVNDTSSLCSTSVASNPINPGIVVNRTNISTSRVYSSSKGVQTNHDIDPIISNTVNCIPSKVVENKLHNVNMTKAGSIMAIGNNKNNVIMTCKTVSSIKNIPQVSPSSSHQLITSNIDNNVKKEFTGMPISKVPTTFTTSCNNSSSSSNVIYSIPIQSDSKSNSIIEKHLQGVTQVQKQLKVTPSIIKSVLCKHPTWQNNSFRQGKQSTEVQTSSTLIPSNIVKTTIDSSNNKISININKQNVTEQNVSSSMMEQVREFESVLEEVRKTSLMNEMSTASMLPQINHEIIQIHSPTENVDLLNADSNQSLFPLNKKLNINNKRDRCSFSFLNQTLSNDLASEDKEPVATSSTIISVRSSTPTPRATSPNNSDVSVNPVDGSTQCSKQIANKSKPVIKTPASSPSTSAVKVPVLQKPLPKLQEDEQTTQRIYAILDKYAEQLRNSPELKNKPAPRRRTNPPTNPSLNAKRKKSNQLNLKTCSQQTSCSSSGMEMSPTSDMHAIDSEDSSNAVSHFSQINNSPSRNSDEQTTTTAISDTPLIENALINVNDVIKKINVDAENKSKVSQTTQIVVSGASGSFLSIPEGSAGNVRLLVASGKNQKMYRLHCPVTGQGPVVFHQITTKDSNTNDIKISSLQNLNESTILSALTTEDLQVTNTGLGNEILLNTSQKTKVFEHKINKPDIILESMEKAQVLENNEKQLTFPVLKKSQASQSTFSVIHTLPYNSKSESIDNIELLSEAQNQISENIKKNYCNNEQTILNTKQEIIKNSNISIQQEKLNITLKDEQPFIPPESSTSISFEDMGFPSFHSQELEQENDEGPSSINSKNCHQNIINTDKNKNSQITGDCLNDNKVSNNSSNLHKNCAIGNQEKLSNVTTIENSKEEEGGGRSKTNLVLNNVAAASAAEIISTANQTSNSYKQKDDLSSKIGKAECESENENENTLSNTVYNLLDNQSATIMNTKIGSLTFRLINDRSAKNWNSCLSNIMPPGTEKMMEGENLKQLQESFQHTKIKTFKDLKMFVFEQCKKFDNNVETPKEYDLYDDIDGLCVDKPSTNELFPEVAILNDLDKSVSPTLGLLQASTSKLNDTITLQARRKSVLSHTTTSTSIMTGAEQTTSVANKKNKTKVSFLKQALYNEMNQDSNDCETKLFINGNTKTILDAIEQIDSSPESPSNTTAVDSETCMSEDSTSTISSGTPHYNFRKSKRKHIEEDGFIESQVIKRMYRGRTSEDSEEKSETPKINLTKELITEQKSTVDKKESNSRRISSRLKNNNVKNNQHNHHASNKSPQLDSPPYKITTTRTSLRRVSRKTT